MSEFKITKKGKDLVIYYPNEDGIYVDKSFKHYDWMCTISKNSKEENLDWNDYIVPELKDVKLIMDCYNNFDKVYKTAEVDLKYISGL